MKKSKLGLGIFVLAVTFIFSVLASSDAGAYSASVDKTQVTQGECLVLTWSGFGDTCNIIVYKGTTQWVYANTQAYYQGTQQICTTEWEVRSDYKIRVEQKSNTTIYIYSQTFAVEGPKPHLVDFLINGGAFSTTGQTVVLQFNFTTADPTHYIMSESDIFSGATWIPYTGNNTVNFTLSSGSGMKFVYFKLKNAYGESDRKFDTIEYVSINYYNVGGSVKDSSGLGISGVVLSGFPSDSTGIKTTLSDGSYLATHVVSTWSGIITPGKSGYTFSPISRSYSGLLGNMSNQNFIAIPNVAYSWQTGVWGECNDTCGNGRKIRLVQCIRSSDGQAVSDNYCTDTKPESISYDCPELGPSRLINDLGGEMYE
ncbi:MAG: thrombospondin type-1 domain-containing protein [Calditrichaceae bacterium]|nr:thrombospondin type-1 domain-containing protein [Calditrichaceae bacterium]